MNNKKAKWLIYTVLVGLIPIICRFFVWLVTKENIVDLILPSDLIAFGLILHISNINEIEHFEESNSQWKTIQNGISIVFIAIYSVFFTLTLFDKNFIDIEAITKSTFALCVVSFLLSYSVFDRISQAEKNPSEAIA